MKRARVIIPEGLCLNYWLVAHGTAGFTLSSHSIPCFQIQLLFGCIKEAFARAEPNGRKQMVELQGLSRSQGANTAPCRQRSAVIQMMKREERGQLKLRGLWNLNMLSFATWWREQTKMSYFCTQASSVKKDENYKKKVFRKKKMMLNVSLNVRQTLSRALRHIGEAKALWAVTE